MDVEGSRLMICVIQAGWLLCFDVAQRKGNPGSWSGSFSPWTLLTVGAGRLMSSPSLPFSRSTDFPFFLGSPNSIISPVMM